MRRRHSKRAQRGLQDPSRLASDLNPVDSYPRPPAARALSYWGVGSPCTASGRVGRRYSSTAMAAFPGEFGRRAIGRLEIASAISTRCRHFGPGSGGTQVQAWVPAETRPVTRLGAEWYRRRLGARVRRMMPNDFTNCSSQSTQATEPHLVWCLRDSFSWYREVNLAGRACTLYEVAALLRLAGEPLS